MRNTVTWIFEDNWTFAIIRTEDNEELLVEKWNFWNAKDWDNVKAVNLSDNPNIQSYKVKHIIKMSKNWYRKHYN